MSRILERFHMLEKVLDTFNLALIKIKNISHEDYYYTNKNYFLKKRIGLARKASREIV